LWFVAAVVLRRYLLGGTSQASVRAADAARRQEAEEHRERLEPGTSAAERQEARAAELQARAKQENSLAAEQQMAEAAETRSAAEELAAR
jgi:hypothetical protein